MSLNGSLNRKLRMGLIGGGKGAFIGRVHATAAILEQLVWVVALLGALTVSGVSAQDLVPVRLQLQWVVQSQFAGYFAAVDQGFWQVREVAGHCLQAGSQQAVQVAGLRLPFAGGGLVGHFVALQNGDALEMLAENTGGEQPTQAATNHNSVGMRG